MIPVASGHANRTTSLRAVCDRSDSFFTTRRTKRMCRSTPPSKTTVESLGDYSQAWWMKSFFDGTIDLSLQVDALGCILLNRDDAERVQHYKNPLRDPLIIVRRDNTIHLRDGFHRLCEALARGYRGRVWTVVLDMDLDESEDD
jgi:hypothetical protein